MNIPIYVPPKPKKALRIASDNIAARLNTAKRAPVIESQLLIDAGSFMFFQK